MRAVFLQRCRTIGYFFSSFLCILLGYLAKNHLVVLDESVLLVLRESPYLSCSLPIWGTNVIASILMLFPMFSMVPVRQVLRQHSFQATVFSILLILTAVPLHSYLKSDRFYGNNLLPISYFFILSSIGVVLVYRGIIRSNFTRLHTLLTRFFHWVNGVRPYTFILFLFFICFLWINFISWRVYEHTPRYSDSCAYLFQARLFADGMLYALPPPEQEFFSVSHIVITDKWYSQYPPGYPAILALGVLVDLPWGVNPLLGSLTVVGIYLLAKELYGNSIAKLSAVLACTSSFFFLMSAEFMAHTSTLFFVTLAFLSFVWMVKKKRPLLSAVVCGVSLGIAVLCRPYTTFWICVPLGVAALVQRKQFASFQFLVVLIPLLVGCVVFLGYNYATTGHPFLLGYIALHGKGHYPGFHLDPGGEQFHTTWQGINHLFGNLNALNYYLFQWPMPSLFFLCFFLGFGKKEGWEWLLIGWLSTLLLGHFFYYFGTLDFGPRFVYEAIPAVLLLTSRGLALGTEYLASWYRLSYAHVRNGLCLTICGLFLFAFLFNIPNTASSYKNYGTDVTIQKNLNKAKVANALVFVKGTNNYRVHYPFNAPFAKPHIYAKNRGSENKKLAEKFPDYRYFIADEDKIVEVSIDEL